MRAVLLVALIAILGGTVFAITQVNKTPAPAQQATLQVPAANYSSPPSVIAPQSTSAPLPAPQAVEQNIVTSQPQMASQYPAAIEDVVQTTSVSPHPITVQVEPPPMPIYVVPPPPAPNYAWVPGHWMWNRSGYYWIPGTWVSPPAPHVLWTPGYWAWNAGLFIWHVGYWGPHIGFYGGVHYGGGYDGVGFSGGEWRNNDYVVNRSVTNVTNITKITNVTNVTNIRNVTNVTNETASFNGGPGGVQAQPTSQQEAALHEQHVAPPPEQIQHIRAASMNESLRASANGGKPSVTATSTPLKAQEPNAAPPKQEEANRPVEKPSSVPRPENQPQKSPEVMREERTPGHSSSPKPEERPLPKAANQESTTHTVSGATVGELSKPKVEILHPAPPGPHNDAADAEKKAQNEPQKGPPVHAPENKPAPKKPEPHPAALNNQKDKPVAPQRNPEKEKPPEEKKTDEHDHQEQEHPNGQ